MYIWDRVRVANLSISMQIKSLYEHAAPYTFCLECHTVVCMRCAQELERATEERLQIDAAVREARARKFPAHCPRIECRMQGPFEVGDHKKVSYKKEWILAEIESDDLITSNKKPWNSLQTSLEISSSSKYNASSSFQTEK